MLIVSVNVNLSKNDDERTNDRPQADWQNRYPIEDEQFHRWAGLYPALLMPVCRDLVCPN
jgi:hypothetical protein